MTEKPASAPAQEGTHQFVRVERRDGFALVVLSRPDVMNAFCLAMTRELASVLDELEKGPERVIVLSGAGERAFSAGADVGEMLKMTVQGARAGLNEGIALTRRLETSSKVTIAAVNGYALGGGTEVALACDIRLASPKAVFGLPEVTVGIFPGWGGTVRLPRLVPRGIALEIILTGRTVKADEALRIGLVNAIEDDVLGAAGKVAQAILRQAPIPQRQAKLVVQRSADLAIDDALILENEAWMTTYFSADRVEGHRAFLERRPPIWSDS